VGKAYKLRMKLYASLIAGDLGNIRQQIKLLEEAGIDGIHFDVMDGMAVDRFGLPPEILKVVKEATNLPIDIHLMIKKPTDKFGVSDEFELVMGVVPGTSGQPILPNTYQRISALKKITNKPIMIDGGVTLETAPLLKEAGADALVVGRVIFEGNLKENIRRFHEI
jgi:pentose-5-phosphate-3-epimerase